MQLTHTFNANTTTASVTLVNEAGQPHFSGSADLADEAARKQLASALAQSLGRTDWPTLDGQLSKIADHREAQLAAMPKPNIKPWQAFPIDLIPDPLRTYATQAATEMGVEPAMVAVPMLVAAAGAIGNSYELRLSETWREPAVLWAAIVAESGSMKSPAIKAATHFIREHQFAEFRRAEQEQETWTRMNAHLPKREQGPKPAPARRWQVNDVTIEALASRLAENPRGLLLMNDELGRWFASFTRYDSAGADQWLEMYGAQTLIIDRKSTDVPVQTIRHAAVSVCGGIQPGPLARKLGEEAFDSGLAARLMLVMPPRSPKTFVNPQLQPELVASAGAVFQHLLSLQPAGNGRDHWPHATHLSPQAVAVWAEFVSSHGQIGIDLEGPAAALHAKVEGQAARLALVTRLIRWASGEPMASLEIDEPAMQAGIKLTQWFGQETGRVYGVLKESQQDKVLRKCIEVIRRHGGTITTRDYARRHGRSAQQAEQQFQELVAAGYARWEESPPGPGRPTRRIALLDPAPTATQQPTLALAG